MRALQRKILTAARTAFFVDKNMNMLAYLVVQTLIIT